MSIFLAGDCEFGKNSSRDFQLVQSWNEKIHENDEIVVLGRFWADEWDDNAVQRIIKKIDANMVIIDYAPEKYGNRDKERLRGLGFAAVYNSFCYVADTITLAPSISDTLREKAKSKMLFLVSPRSISGATKVLEDNLFSVSIEDWGDFPVDYDSIPMLIENIKHFEEE